MKLGLCIQSIVLLLGLSVCTQASAELKVLACEPEWAALTREIGGDLVAVTSATTAFQDAHHIEARPSLIAKARKADLLFCTGAELEVGWLPILVRQSGNANIQVGEAGHLMASDFVSRLEVPDQVSRSMGDIHASGNPHVHLDPRRLLKIAKELTARLREIDPANSASYENNLADFARRWSKAIEGWEVKAQSLKGKRVIIHHTSFSYLFDWLDIEAVGDMEPKPGLPPTSGHLAKLLSSVSQNRPDLIVIAAYKSEKAARWLERRSKLPMVVLPFTVGGNPQSKTLFSLYDSTLQLLLEAVQANG